MDRTDNPHIAPEAELRQVHDWDLAIEFIPIETGVSFQSCSNTERDVFKGNGFTISLGM